MKALTITDVHKIELLEVEVPRPQADEVLVKVAYCGICGSDLPRYFDGGVHQFPQVLGHEFSGTIVEMGDDVTDYQIGDRVVVAPLVPCADCNQCLGGHPQLCAQYSFIGSRRQGGLADYVAVPVDNLVKVPEGLSLKEAALVEPITVAIHGVEAIRTQAGDRALVLGSGTIGLLTVMILKVRGINDITVIDLNDNKLEKAKRAGAKVVLNPLKEDIGAYFKSNQRPELVYETAGSHLTQVQAITYAGRNAKISYVGTCTRDIIFKPEEFEQILRKELEIRGVWMSYSAPFPGYEWPAALNYLADGAINTDDIITSLYKLEDLGAAFDAMVAEGSEELKVLFEVNPE